MRIGYRKLVRILQSSTANGNVLRTMCNYLAVSIFTPNGEGISIATKLYYFTKYILYGLINTMHQLMHASS